MVSLRISTVLAGSTPAAPLTCRMAAVNSRLANRWTGAGFSGAPARTAAPSKAFVLVTLVRTIHPIPRWGHEQHHLCFDLHQLPVFGRTQRGDAAGSRALGPLRRRE